MFALLFHRIHLFFYDNADISHSIDEYLDLDMLPEYYRGEIFAISGAQVPHNTIVGNLFIVLGQKPKGKKSKPFNCDQRI